MGRARVSLVLSTVVAGFLFGGGSARATFIIDTSCTESGCPDSIAMHVDDAKNTNSFFGNVISTDDIGITSMGNVDVSNGDATVKPIKDGSLTELTLTPVDPTEFASFDFRGQLSADSSTVVVTVQDNQGDAPQMFDFTGLPANADFAAIGIIGTGGETIKSVEVSDTMGFKELKHFQFDSTTGVIPETSTWAMMLVGFAGLGFASYRKTRKAILFAG